MKKKIEKVYNKNLKYLFEDPIFELLNSFKIPLLKDENTFVEIFKCENMTTLKEIDVVRDAIRKGFCKVSMHRDELRVKKTLLESIQDLSVFCASVREVFSFISRYNGLLDDVIDCVASEQERIVLEEDEVVVVERCNECVFAVTSIFDENTVVEYVKFDEERRYFGLIYVVFGMLMLLSNILGKYAGQVVNGSVIDGFSHKDILSILLRELRRQEEISRVFGESSCFELQPAIRNELMSLIQIVNSVFSIHHLVIFSGKDVMEHMVCRCRNYVVAECVSLIQTHRTINDLIVWDLERSVLIELVRKYERINLFSVIEKIVCEIDPNMMYKTRIFLLLVLIGDMSREKAPTKIPLLFDVATRNYPEEVLLVNSILSKWRIAARIVDEDNYKELMYSIYSKASVSGESFFLQPINIHEDFVELVQKRWYGDLKNIESFDELVEIFGVPVQVSELLSNGTVDFLSLLVANFYEFNVGQKLIKKTKNSRVYTLETFMMLHRPLTTHWNALNFDVFRMLLVEFSTNIASGNYYVSPRISTFHQNYDGIFLTQFVELFVSDQERDLSTVKELSKAQIDTKNLMWSISIRWENGITIPCYKTTVDPLFGRISDVLLSKMYDNAAVSFMKIIRTLLIVDKIKMRGLEEKKNYDIKSEKLSVDEVPTMVVMKKSVKN